MVVGDQFGQVREWAVWSVFQVIIKQFYIDNISDGQITNQYTSGLTVNVSTKIRDGTITEINSFTQLQ